MEQSGDWFRLFDWRDLFRFAMQSEPYKIDIIYQLSNYIMYENNILHDINVE